jgi:hypothetical protein
VYPARLLRGRVDHIDGTTGELLHRYSTVPEPGGVLPVACKTRRASRCPPCAEVYSTQDIGMPGPPRSAGVEGARIRDLNIRVINAATGELLRELNLDPAREYQPTSSLIPSRLPTP